MIDTPSKLSVTINVCPDLDQIGLGPDFDQDRTWTRPGLTFQSLLWCSRNWTILLTPVCTLHLGGYYMYMYTVQYTRKANQISVVEELDDSRGVLLNGDEFGVHSQQLEQTQTSSLLHPRATVPASRTHPP